MELALMCDLRVMEESAIMGIFCRRFGVPLIDGGTVRLPKLIGLSHALDLILTARPVGAKEALIMGLANRFVATGTAPYIPFLYVGVSLYSYYYKTFPSAASFVKGIRKHGSFNINKPSKL
ncbi:hypothetical protein ACJMK2_000566 [Sinanodonta woodiana]|uniref:Uncharacterized protein n=1 Tax=Sinanodonta woodiana TaxID=1069815 RepID=A0ABD3XSY8_SINWO